MTLIDKIKKSVEGATGLPFLYHAAGEINELIARCQSLPVAYSFLIDSGTIDDVNGRYHERITLAVMFCDKTEFDFNALENEEIIDRMKEKAYKWMSSLRMSNTLNVVSVNNTQRLYDTTTDILTGFAVNITIEDIAGVGECELPQVVIDVKKNGSYDVVGVDKVRVNVLPKLEDLEVTQNGEYLPPTDIDGFRKVSVNVQPTLEELTITENGIYTPQEGVDGFSKVTARVVQEKKTIISSFSIGGNVIGENGYWLGDANTIDWSYVNNITGCFSQNNKIKYIDMSDWNIPHITSFSTLFKNAINIIEIIMPKNPPLSISNIYEVFANCTYLKALNLIGIMFPINNEYNTQRAFLKCKRLTTIIGDNTIEDVLRDNISVLTGLKATISFADTALDRASLRAIINGLADLSGTTATTLTLGATLRAKITEEDIAVATNKNWTIV